MYHDMSEIPAAPAVRTHGKIAKKIQGVPPILNKKGVLSVLGAQQLHDTLIASDTLKNNSLIASRL